MCDGLDRRPVQGRQDALVRAPFRQPLVAGQVGARAVGKGGEVALRLALVVVVGLFSQDLGQLVVVQMAARVVQFGDRASGRRERALLWRDAPGRQSATLSFRRPRMVT
jgi:hypothetical protein